MSESVAVTEVILGRTFTRDEYLHVWRCKTKHGTLVLRTAGPNHFAELQEDGVSVCAMSTLSEENAIFRLQAKLRGMAALEPIRTTESTIK